MLGDHHMHTSQSGLSFDYMFYNPVTVIQPAMRTYKILLQYYDHH